jgi:hypothetical protein
VDLFAVFDGFGAEGEGQEEVDLLLEGKGLVEGAEGLEELGEEVGLSWVCESAGVKEMD